MEPGGHSIHKMLNFLKVLASLSQQLSLQSNIFSSIILTPWISALSKSGGIFIMICCKLACGGALFSTFSASFCYNLQLNINYISYCLVNGFVLELTSSSSSDIRYNKFLYSSDNSGKPELFCFNGAAYKS